MDEEFNACDLFLMWNRDTKVECIGTNALWNYINSFVQQYKTNIVLTKINQNYRSNLDKYCIEVWYNFDSGCRLINAYTLEYNEPDRQIFY